MGYGGPVIDLHSQTRRVVARPRRGGGDAIRGGEDLAIEDAVARVANRLDGTLAALPALAGAHGRLATDYDLRLHARFLMAAVETATPRYFVDFVHWQRSAMEARGLPATLLKATLGAMREAFASHLAPAARQAMDAIVDAGLGSLTAAAQPTDLLDGRHLPEPSPLAADLAEHLVAGDASACRALVQREARRSRSYVQVAVHVLQPALYQVGLMWQRNTISVAQEHMATAIVQTLLTQIYTTSLFTPPIHRRAVFAAVQGNSHAVGLRMVSDAFELSGWSVRYLGADTPTEAIVAEVRTSKPQLVGLSASMAQQLPDLRRAVTALRESLGSRCPRLVVGGHALNQIDDIWKWTGADAWSPDAAQGVKATA